MRSTAEALELDASLRQARTIYVTMAIVLFPFAIVGVFNVIIGLAAMLGSAAAGSDPAITMLLLLFGIICIGAEYVTTRQWLEASRRLRILRENPEANVRTMKAPFQASLFGPYH